MVDRLPDVLGMPVRISAMVEALPCGLALLDPQGRFLFCNSAFIASFGIEGDPSGQDPAQLLIAEDRAGFVAAMASARAKACASTKGARRFGSTCWSHEARVASCHSSRSKVLALFTSTPTGPSAASAAGSSPATSASRRRFESSTAASGSTKSVCPSVGAQGRAVGHPAGAHDPPRAQRPAGCRDCWPEA